MDANKIRLENMMKLYGTDILRYCTLQLKDAKQAEDAAQEVFIKAWRALDRFQGRSNERTWLLRIAINTCRDYQRTGWFRRMDRSITPEDLPECGAEDRSYDRLPVTEAVRQLPPGLRNVIWLRYYEGMKLPEIAQTVGLSEATVKRRLSNAAAILRQKLEGWYEDE